MFGIKVGEFAGTILGHRTKEAENLDYEQASPQIGRFSQMDFTRCVFDSNSIIIKCMFLEKS